MGSLTSFGGILDYRDILQVDGAYYAAHVKYGKSPKFNGKHARTAVHVPGKERVSLEGRSDDYVDCDELTDGMDRDLKQGDRVELWKNYWLEYVNAFDKLAAALPESVITVFVGRQAIELGMKFILLEATGQFPRWHDLGKLSEKLFSELEISEGYMDWICVFCKQYSEHIEGGQRRVLQISPVQARRIFWWGLSRYEMALIQFRPCTAQTHPFCKS